MMTRVKNQKKEGLARRRTRWDELSWVNAKSRVQKWRCNAESMNKRGEENEITRAQSPVSPEGQGLGVERGVQAYYQRLPAIHRKVTRFPKLPRLHGKAGSCRNAVVEIFSDCPSSRKQKGDENPLKDGAGSYSTDRRSPPAEMHHRKCREELHTERITNAHLL